MNSLPLQTIQDRFRATLLGLAIGDALGFPYEGAPPEAIGRVPGLSADFVARPRGHFPKGQYTDETQMTSAMVDALLAGDLHFDGRIFGLKLVQLWTRGPSPIVRPEALCVESIERLAKGAPWHTSGAPMEREGVGALVRAAPLGLIHHERLDRIQRDAESQAILTHKNLASRAGAVAFATAVGLNLNGAWLSPESFCHHVAAAAAMLDPSLGAEIERVAKLIHLEPAIAARVIVRAGLKPLAPVDREGVPPRVLPSLLMALYAFLRAGENFPLCMEIAIKAGGITNTVAAMAGALFGAKRGTAALPSRLRKHLLEGERLVTLSDRLFTLWASKKPPPPAYATAAATARGGASRTHDRS